MLEVAYHESRKLRDTLNGMEVETDEMCKNIKLKDVQLSDFKAETVKLRTSNDRLELIKTQLEENILMLENVVETERGKVKELEKNILQACDKCENVGEFNSELCLQKEKLHTDVPSTSKCGSCEFESPNANDMNTHSQIKHEFACEDCEIIFKNKVKLETHMCRIIIKNPMYGDYYTKNWVIAKNCTRIFSNSGKKEILFLHSKQCIDHTSSCQDLNSEYVLPNYYGNAFHAPLKEYFSGGLINWDALHGQFDINIK